MTLLAWICARWLLYALSAQSCHTQAEGKKSAAGTLFRHPLACGTCPGTHGAAVRIVRLQLQAIKKSMSHISQGKTRSFSLGRARLSNRGSIVLSLN